LKSWFNPEVSKVIEGLTSGRESIIEGAYVEFFLTDNYGEPTKFHKAYNHPEPDSRVRLHVTICKELRI
jgi:hypothetical protein